MFNHTRQSIGHQRLAEGGNCSRLPSQRLNLTDHRGSVVYISPGFSPPWGHNIFPGIVALSAFERVSTRPNSSFNLLPIYIFVLVVKPLNHESTPATLTANKASETLEFDPKPRHISENSSKLQVFQGISDPFLSYPFKAMHSLSN